MRSIKAEHDPILGLDAAARAALSDVAQSMLGRFATGWRGFAGNPHPHAEAAVAALDRAGLVRFLSEDIVTITPRGTRAARAIRTRRAAVAAWDRAKGLCHD